MKIDIKLPVVKVPKNKCFVDFKLKDVNKYRDGVIKLSKWLKTIINHGEIVHDLMSVNLNFVTPVRKFLDVEIQLENDVVYVSFEGEVVPIGKVPQYFIRYFKDDNEYNKNKAILSYLKWISNLNNENFNIGIMIRCIEGDVKFPSYFRKNLEIFNFRIAGVTFDDRQDVLKSILFSINNDKKRKENNFKRVVINAVRESDNKYDKNAIAIELTKSVKAQSKTGISASLSRNLFRVTKQVRLGYVPKKDALMIASKIDKEWHCEATLQSVYENDGIYGASVLLELIEGDNVHKRN